MMLMVCMQVDFAAARPPLAERKRKVEEQDVPGTVKAQKTAPDKPAAKPKSAEAPASAQPQRLKPAATLRPAKHQRGKAQPKRQLSAAAAEKQRLVLTVAVGGIPVSCRDAVLKLAAGAGNVSRQLHRKFAFPLVFMCSLSVGM